MISLEHCQRSNQGPHPRGYRLQPPEPSYHPIKLLFPLQHFPSRHVKWNQPQSAYSWFSVRVPNFEGAPTQYKKIVFISTPTCPCCWLCFTYAHNLSTPFQLTVLVRCRSWRYLQWCHRLDTCTDNFCVHLLGRGPDAQSICKNGDHWVRDRD